MSSDPHPNELDAALQAFVQEARQSESSPRFRDPVNRPMIHHWCDAIGDLNPVYSDEELASQSIHGGIVAPPTMLQAWSMPGLAGRGPSLPEDAAQPAPQDRVGGPTTLLHRHGYTSVVATDCEQSYRRYLRPGDRLSMRSVLESISGEKKTALGDGYFVTNLTTYYDEDDEPVGDMRFRVFWFKPRNIPGEAGEEGRQ